MSLDQGTAHIDAMVRIGPDGDCSGIVQVVGTGPESNGCAARASILLKNSVG
ncbi:MAG: hypothetical protein JRE58_01070 [Deltaproteobacteria bacterium]|nr:hypothetical protein [Deltaproteobacteria bacterium]